MKSLIKKITKTSPEYSSLIMRLSLGIMILPHGLQKTLGLFGGNGFTKTISFFTQSEGIPFIFAFLAIIAESLGGLALILGCFTRVAALGVGSVMAVAMTKHLQNGFFMNWFGKQNGEGIEFFILAIGLALALIIKGSGNLSIDKVLKL